METEASREALRKELSNQQRRMADFEDRARCVEKDLKMALEESRTSERRLDDNRRNLEIQVDTANEEIQVSVCSFPFSCFIYMYEACEIQRMQYMEYI